MQYFRILPTRPPRASSLIAQILRITPVTRRDKRAFTKIQGRDQYAMPILSRAVIARIFLKDLERYSLLNLPPWVFGMARQMDQEFRYRRGRRCCNSRSCPLLSL